MKRLLVCFLCLFPAYAYPFFLNGDDLYKYSDINKKVESYSASSSTQGQAQPTSDDVIKSGFYRGYITGYVDTMEQGKIFCIRSNDDLKDAFAIIYRNLDSIRNTRPSELQQPANLLLEKILREGKPCPG